MNCKVSILAYIGASSIKTLKRVVLYYTGRRQLQVQAGTKIPYFVCRKDEDKSPQHITLEGIVDVSKVQHLTTMVPQGMVCPHHVQCASELFDKHRRAALSDLPRR
jgi:hypothetical protein